MTVKVSVILPFHREPDSLLENAISSVKDSLGINTELILVDDRINPMTKLLGFKESCNVTSGGVGYASALNLGKSFVQSDYLALMNSDDLIHPRRLITQVRLIQSTGIAISLCGTKNIGSIFAHRNVLGSAPSTFYSKKLLLLGAYGANASLVGLTKFFENRYWDDIDMSDWKFALENYPEEISQSSTSELLYFYRRHSGQVTKKERKMPSALIDCARKYSESLGLVAGSDAVIKAASAPFLFPNLSPTDKIDLIDYIEKLHRFFSAELKSYELAEVEKIVIRRLLLADKGRLLAPYFRKDPRALSLTKIFNEIPRLLADLAARTLS
jgi:glycosyltransferase involved in cell wall biosynthesis